MARNVNHADAANWPADEVEDNLAYLESRGRMWELEQAKAALGEKVGDPADPTWGDRSGYEVGDDDVADAPASYPAEAPIHESAAKASKSTGARKADVPDGTVDEVMDWVGDDPKRAAKALAVEDEKDEPRVTLVERLEALSA